MINFFTKRMNKKGFTLVELLIVIAVLGIIAAIAVPRMAGVTDAVKTSADEEQAKLIASNVENLFLSNAFKPTADTTGATKITKADYGEDYPKGQSTTNFLIAYYEKSGLDITVTIHYSSSSTAQDADRANATAIHTLTFKDID